MAQYPEPIQNREELNLRLGIKSSLNNLRSVVGSLYAMYIAAGKPSHIDYTEEVSSNGVFSLKMNSSIKSAVLDYFNDSAIIENIEATPLFKAQIESLQVGLELFFHIAKVSLGKSGLSERTGSSRYNKCLDFSTNFLLLDLLLSSFPENDVKAFLSSWIVETPCNTELEKKVLMMLSVFSEDTQCKIRTYDGKEVYFQREGIYKLLTEGNPVISEDAKEIVGPYRILKSYVSSGMHPFLQDKNKEFQSKADKNTLSAYAAMVSTMLDLSPRRQMVIQEEVPLVEDSKQIVNDIPLQQIIFGAPGTGKSHQIKVKTGELDAARSNVFRTTFHPDTDYATFVGCYKPTMKTVEEKYRAVAGKEEDIVYEFVPQAFTDAYLYAYKNPAENTFLVIEEINRGNCAQIFGDLFQLLDRNEEGISEYTIKADKDLAKYLTKELGADSDGIKEGKLRLPANLHILATMNTSDQSLFPMDSAFKRRWDWQYVAISYSEPKSSTFKINVGEGYSWVDFIEQVNKRIFDLTQSEDKEMGNFFIKDSIDAEQFKSKVMFYLWFEVLRDEVENSKYFFYYTTQDESGKETNHKFTFKDLYGEKAETILEGFLKYITKDAE